MTDEQKQQIESNFRIFNASEDTKYTFFEHFWEANSEMTITEYQFYSSSEFWIDIASENDFATSIRNLENIQSAAYGFGYGKDGKVFVTLRARIFEPNYNWGSPNNQYGGLPYSGSGLRLTKYDWDLTSAIQHELGHGYSAFILGNKYHSWASFYKENWAKDYTNFSYRSGLGLPYEAFGHAGKRDSSIFDWLFKGRNP